MWPNSSILMCYWFPYDLIPACLCIIDYHVTSFQHTNVLLILMWHYSSILRYYWFLYDPIPAYYCIVDLYVNSFQHTNVLLILMSPHSIILMSYWLSCDLIPAYLCIIDYHVTWNKHTNALSIIKCGVNSHVILFQNTNVLWNTMWPHSSILIYYWFSCDLISAY